MKSINKLRLGEKVKFKEIFSFNNDLFSTNL